MIHVTAIAYMNPALFERLNGFISEYTKGFCTFTNTYPPDEQWEKTISEMGVIDLIVVDYCLYADIQCKDSWLELLTRAMLDSERIMPDMIVNYCEDGIEGCLELQNTMFHKKLACWPNSIGNGDETYMEMAALNIRSAMERLRDAKQRYARKKSEADEVIKNMLDMADDHCIVR